MLLGDLHQCYWVISMDENTHQQQKSQQTVVNNRVDNNKPMFKSSRPSFSGGGGGAINPMCLLMLLGLGGLRYRKMKQ